MLLLFACAGNTPDSAGAGDGSLDPDEAWDEPEHPLFSDRTLQTVRLTLPAGWEDTLWTYAQEDDACGDRRTIAGELVLDNAVTGVSEQLGSVEVRFRGHSALEAGPDSDGERPGFKLDLEPYGTTVHGREKLNLLGTEGDYTLMREVLAYKLMRRLGLPAPYAGYTLLYVDGELLGVYPLSEEPDTQGYLDHHFDDPDGNLYKVEGYCGGRGRLTWLGDDPDDYDEIYDAKAGTGATHGEDLLPLLDCASNTGHEEFLGCIGEHADVDTWLTHVAADIAMPDVDGLPSAGQNYLLYADPDRGFVPYSWDKDQAFDLESVTSESIYDLHPVWAEDVEVELVDRLRELFDVDYCAAVERAAGRVDPEVLVSEVDRLREHLSEAIEDDPFMELERWEGVVEDILDDAAVHHAAVVEEAAACSPPQSEDPGWSDEVLVAPGASWLWTGEEPAEDWTAAGFDAGAWESGDAPLGYGTEDLATEIEGVTVWFRHAFTVDEDHDGTLTLGLRRDDGAVVYLDGEEVVRDNMPSGTIDADTLASKRVDGDDEETLWEHALDSGIAAGEHVLAVELHQASSSSGDAALDLRLEVARE